MSKELPNGKIAQYEGLNKIVVPTLKPGFAAIFHTINTLAQEVQKNQADLGGTKVKRHEIQTTLPKKSFITKYGDRPDLSMYNEINAFKTETSTVQSASRSGKRDSIDDVEDSDEDPAGTYD